ncbi:MAG: YjbH domain-containing protein [Candidatus Tectimicrobiota bacterium]
MLRGGPALLLGLLLLLLAVAEADAALLRVPQQYPTIQEAMALAVAGDTVLVASGLYYEPVVLKPGVHLSGDPGAILDGSRTEKPVVTALHGVARTTVLSGFVIRAGQQAGIFLNQAAPTIRNNVIIDNAGPGILCAQASPQVVNNALIRNAGGGVFCQYPDTTPDITYNAFWQNQSGEAPGCVAGEGNRTVEPGFLAVSQDDYRLRPDSPLRDAGHPDPAWQDHDGTRSDIGIGGGPAIAREVRRVHQRALGVFEEIFGASEVLRDNLSAWGLPGIIHVPTATMVPAGSLDVGYNITRDPDVFPTVDRQKNFTFALGFLPRVTIGGRGTVATPHEGETDLARDISANVQILLLEDKAWWPSVAIGVQDISGGAAFFHSRYVTLSKSLFGRVRGTVGFGLGPDVLDGPFGGVELALNRYITLLGEYDARVFNAGVRMFPLPEKLEAYGIPRPTVDVIWQDGRRVAWGINVRSVLGEGKFQAQRAGRAHKRYSRPSVPPTGTVSFQHMSEQLQATLIEQGLENVRVSVFRQEAGYLIAVEYENRRYNRDELDAVGVVLGLATLATPPLITAISVTVKEVNIPVLHIVTGAEAFLSFVNEELPAGVFAQQLRITQEVQELPAAAVQEATTPIRSRSWLKVDAFLQPRIETRLLTEVGVADLRFSLLPEAMMQLTPGTVVDVRGVVPITQTSGFGKSLDNPGIERQLGDPELDRALLHQAVRLPLGSWSKRATGLAQVSIGRFTREEVGIAEETAVTLLEGSLFVKGTVARVGSSFDDLDQWVALANGRVRYSPWDLTFSVTAGRFLDGDQGVAADLSRFFGSTEIGVFLRHSDNGSLAGLRLGIPLTPARELPPWRVRPRLPDLFAYEQRTTVFTDFNVLRGDIGRSLSTGHDIERVYWNRDRLYPVYIRQHLDTLRQAVRRWIDETS